MPLINEIAPGLVLHIDPVTMAAQGGTTDLPDFLKVKKAHFFVCLSVDGNQGRWMPCYTKDGKGRHPIAENSRTGHPKWAKGNCYFHPAQVWSASHAAVVNAAQAAHDQSQPGQRNMLALGNVDNLPG
ncbi:hypothetical protein GRF61_23785 [Azoarcus sp. TTM-91]|uniref:hypothetical protein n=1 Tax=Azoarcus sp. TTM-91 TaxID=2691581 RepID=UPI00145DA83A|nr:hypothetical protein [Azoarcus sp. TTM-91]NMG37483.1 hypothetical protein [Azoarcus sp. TTM-91]